MAGNLNQCWQIGLNNHRSWPGDFNLVVSMFHDLLVDFNLAVGLSIHQIKFLAKFSRLQCGSS